MRFIALLTALSCILFDTMKVLGFVSIRTLSYGTNANKAANTDDDDLSLDSFQKAKQNVQNSNSIQSDGFDGYALRDVLYQKWGQCYDVDFNRVDVFGFRKLYLNVLPFRLGKRPFRHATEYDYLCHLQAVVEILQQYKQLDYVIYQIQETKQTPKAGAPIKAVPLRLDLTPQQMSDILGYNM